MLVDLLVKTELLFFDNSLLHIFYTSNIKPFNTDPL